MMRKGLARLESKPRRIRDIVSYICDIAKGKDVLNVGASGGVEFYLPDNKEVWLHYRLSTVANEVVGIDIDEDSIRYAKQNGVEILCYNCESMDLGRRFDVIVMSEVIEHLDAPGKAVSTLMNHLERKGKLLITTPNPTSIGILLKTLLKGNPGVYYDHVTCFFPENLQAMCNRFGYKLGQVLFFDHIDRRTRMLQFKSKLFQTFGLFVPKISQSFLGIIEHGNTFPSFAISQN